MSQIPTLSRPARLDRLCAEAVELARAAAEETGEGVGEYLHAEPEADRVVTHFFDSTLAGYQGWRWAVVVARAPRSRTVTVNETALLPGPDALKAPDWVPWAERLQAGDVGVGDLLPTDESDARLMPAYALNDDDAVEDIAFELGVGRARVMSREGRIDCAERWYEGEHGPGAEISTSAPPEARCGGCGFYLPLAGSMRQLFGVCGNMYAADDASVVSADHGCGAHSEVMSQLEIDASTEVEQSETIYDDAVIERIDTGVADESDEPVAEVAEEPATETDAKPETEAAAKPDPATAEAAPADTEGSVEPAEAAATEPVAQVEAADEASTEVEDAEAPAEATSPEPVVQAETHTGTPTAPASVAVETPAEVAVIESDTPEPVEVDVEVAPESAAQAPVEVDVTLPASETAEVTVVAQPQEPAEVASSEAVTASQSDTPEPNTASTDSPSAAETTEN